MKQTIAVLDYGMGNLRSVAKALEHVANPHDRVIISNETDALLRADKWLVPGQGAARDCMQQLRNHGVLDALRAAITTKPVMGICMGMQVLLDSSDENQGTPCLGVVAGQAKAFPKGELKVPHMGWNQVHQQGVHPLFKQIADQARFYFVHSYYVVPEQPEWCLATCEYGLQFTAAMGRDNVFACQFHPEKSAQDGLQLLRNFIAWDGSA